MVLPIEHRTGSCLMTCTPLPDKRKRDYMVIIENLLSKSQCLRNGIIKMFQLIPLYQNSFAAKNLFPKIKILWIFPLVHFPFFPHPTKTQVVNLQNNNCWKYSSTMWHYLKGGLGQTEM